MDQQGILKGSDYERLSGRLNVDSEVTKWLNLSANVNVTYESRRNLDENNSYTATVFSTLAADPITPVYRDNLVDIPDFLQNRIMGGYEPTNPWSRYTGVILLKQTEHGWTGRPLRIKSMARDRHEK